MITNISGKVYKVGDNVDTDVIIPARYLNTMDPEKLRPHLFEDLPNAPKYDGEAIIVAGRNFGCGSSREHAPIVIASAGIEAVVAKSFARIYLRNSIAGGKPFPIRFDDNSAENLYRGIKHGDRLDINLERGVISFGGAEYNFVPFSKVQLGILEAGGLYNLAARELQEAKK